MERLDEGFDQIVLTEAQKHNFGNTVKVAMAQSAEVKKTISAIDKRDGLVNATNSAIRSLFVDITAIGTVTLIPELTKTIGNRNTLTFLLIATVLNRVCNIYGLDRKIESIETSDRLKI